MVICPQCGTQNEDNAAFCTGCGASFAPQPQQPQQVPPPQYVFVDPYDHTSEFDARDISENKVFAMLPYLMGWIGVIIALIASRDSRYVGFHVRQGLKFCVLHILTGIVALVLFWTFIVPIAAGVFTIVMAVIQIISFFSVCSGKAKEPAIIRSLGFLK